MKSPPLKSGLWLEGAKFGLIFLGVSAAYLPALRGGFIWDDDGHVTRPELRSLHGLWRIWFDIGATQQYYPVLHSAFWLEHHLWGDAALGYHLVNVLLHSTSACLFVVLLQRFWGRAAPLGPPTERGSAEMASAPERSVGVSRGGRPTGAEANNPTSGPSLLRQGFGGQKRQSAETSAKAGGPALPRSAAWLAGLIFALHPVCVESVAWISEQKNTLSTVFYLLAALAYFRFYASWARLRLLNVEIAATVPTSEGAGGDRPVRQSLGDGETSSVACWYLLSTVLFVLALLSKSVTATLPAALLVVLWWRKGRLGWKREIFPLLPWFAAAVAVGILTAWVERRYIGAQGARFDLTLGERVLLAGRAIWFYLGKLVWPADLIFVYPRWTVNAGAVWQYFFPPAAAMLLAGAWLVRKRNRGLLTGLLFFVGTLFPALGFFNVYPFVFSYVADHFQYLASLGIIALAAAAWGRWGQPVPPFQGRVEVVRQAVFSAEAVAKEDGLAPGQRPGLPALSAAAILLVLGTLTWRQCRIYRDMETLYRATVERNPASWLAQDNLGVVLARQGRLENAIAHYREALRLNPDYPETHDNYGNALARLHRWREAAVEYGQALRLRPDFSPAAANWARAEYGWAVELGNAGRLAEAIAHYKQAIRLRPDYAEAMADLGLAEAYAGRLPEALGQLRQAIRLRPESPQAHAYLGFALAKSGQFSGAVAEYRESLRLKPDDADVSYQLRMALRAMGQTAEGVSK